MDRYQEAWSRNDWDAAMAIWSEDIVHHVPGHGPLSGTFTGKANFLDHYGRIFEELGGTIEVVGFHDLLVSEDHAVALVTERAIRGERSLDFNRVVVYHVNGEHITETWSYDWDPESLSKFWS
jgi:hypothetical protein